MRYLRRSLARRPSPLTLPLLGIAIALGAIGGQSIHAAEQRIDSDLLVVGGTESGCAAAVQAARMGVRRIVLVNDIEWLGGQFSAEGLGAIDENRGHGYDGTVPIPRSGIFREVIDRIEERNAELYGGVRRPGNTRVITTARPIVSEGVFRELLAPYEASEQIVRFSNYRVENVLTENDRVLGVQFVSPDNSDSLAVHARLTIDASDWGDVIQGSGAAWDSGVDAKSEYGEPSAPTTADPPTDLNPITWCMILEQQDQEQLIPQPNGYDSKYFTGKWGWINEEFAYTSRRLVDGTGFNQFKHADVLLINSPPIDYPLDVYPAEVAAALERTEAGASKKSLVAMTPAQREIVFADARNHSLKFLYHLQQRFPKFRKMALSEEFGTENKLPPKPYVRESLRLIGQHVVSEQEVLGFAARANYARTMFPDAVFCWQFELDFHPTRRSWTTDAGDHGPWEADFRGQRRFGRGGTGRAVFPLRALVPRSTRGLLAAQKNLGYTSIVSSSCRLHDQSIHAGQASGAVAAISLRHDDDPATFFRRPDRLAEIWAGLLSPNEGAPLAIWPFADVDPYDADFAAIQQLAVRRLLPLDAADTSFNAERPATPEWIGAVVSRVRESGYDPLRITVTRTEKRRKIARIVWEHLKSRPIPARKWLANDDADNDQIPDADDPLPFTPGTVSWQLDPARDGLPDVKPPYPADFRAFNFTAVKGATVEGFASDIGKQFDPTKGFGWSSDLSNNTRLRNVDSEPLRDGFVFTREQDHWECEVANGKWNVHGCLGDANHEQPGQNLAIEGQVVAKAIGTTSGHFHEVHTTVVVNDGRLTLTLGVPEGGSNTCINWIWLEPAK